MQSYTKERLQNLSEEEFFNLIAPLWAMGMWCNKQYYLDNVIESNGIDLIREQLINLFECKRNNSAISPIAVKINSKHVESLLRMVARII